MAVLQSKLDELRYMKRQNLEEESKIVGNWYRDVIRQYGVDCNYYKIKVPYLKQFKSIIDDNVMILHAYGQISNSDYSMSSKMITYQEVENDAFLLNQYGVLPNTDVNFYFDSTDFACAMAWKMGQLKEYKVIEKEVEFEVPEVLSGKIEYDEDGDGVLSSDEGVYLSANTFPYGAGYSFPMFYETEILTGRYTVKIDGYELEKEYTVMCHPYEHGEVDLKFPVNDTIYKSFFHKYSNYDFVDQVLFLTYKVSKVIDSEGDRFILHGKLHGAVLFHDLTVVGKYIDQIHPEIGDIVTVDFPDEKNRQQFEITDCYDKQQTSDGINPLLHKYVWKCKARRYINSGEDFPEQNQANERWSENIDFLDNADEVVADQISKYDEDNNDASYGGYERKIESHDRRKVDIRDEKTKFTFIDDGSYIDMHIFSDNSKIVTDGYEMYFVDTQEQCIKLTGVEDKSVINENLVATGIQYLKATDNALYFINFDNRIQRLCEDETITQGEVELCLNSLLDTTYDDRTNNEKGNFYYKFRESNTVLMSLNDHLFCRFGNKNRQMVKIC